MEITITTDTWHQLCEYQRATSTSFFDVGDAKFEDGRVRLTVDADVGERLEQLRLDGETIDQLLGRMLAGEKGLN